MGLDELVDGVQVVSVVCNQFGDTGKGKFSDYFASGWADVIARGTGGNNAGHTVIINGKSRVFHLIPAGISYDKDGKVNILGNGMVIDPSALVKELDELSTEGVSFNNLMISDQAHVIMPYHVEQDVAKNKSQAGGGIGSTGRGIGPAYTDKIARRGVMIRDLFDRDKLAAKIRKASAYYAEQNIDVDGIIDELSRYSETIRPFVRDTVSEMHRFLRDGKKVCLEGAQGLSLSIEHGTYPYVTSSDCSVNGTASGVGISAGAVDLTLGIVKFPFMTRVGGGPFPTEFGGKESEQYCSQDFGNRRDDERQRYDGQCDKILNSQNEFEQGVGIRIAAGEYGATTGRPRRVGWTDAVAARYAAGINGPMKLVLTKPDAISGVDKFGICYGYKLADGEITDQFRNDAEFLRGVTPIYEFYDGYENIRGESKFENLPISLRTSIREFEKFVGSQVAVVSTGPGLEETIVL